MSKGNSYLFHGTIGTEVSGLTQPPESYSDRGIGIPKHIQEMIDKLPKEGDYITGSPSSFDIKDVSIMSKETGVEFTKITIRDKSYLIRGHNGGTDIPKHLYYELIKPGGSFDFHTHPFDDDLVPSWKDKELMHHMRVNCGQKHSTIATPNGRTVIYNEKGVISSGTIPNTMNDEIRKMYLSLFGGDK